MVIEYPKKSVGREPRFFNVSIPVRMNREMVDLINFWVKKLVDSSGKSLYVNKSHFIRSSVLKELNRLKSSKI